MNYKEIISSLYKVVNQLQPFIGGKPDKGIVILVGEPEWKVLSDEHYKVVGVRTSKEEATLFGFPIRVVEGGNLLVAGIEVKP